MDGLAIFEKHEWHPFSAFGLTNPFFAIDQHTIIYTWVALGIILVGATAARLSLLYYPDSLTSYVIKKYVQIFMQNIEQTCHFFSYRYTVFIISLFTFLLVCNCLVVIPTMEEPTKDLNTTIALALVSFIYVQAQAIKTHGFFHYLHEYFKTPLQVFGRHKKITPLAILDMAWRIVANTLVALLTFPLELLGKLASILSLSFRLFGNIFGGSVITSLYKHFAANTLFTSLIAQPWNTLLHIIIVPLTIALGLIISLFFGIFEGVLQAFVFTMLTMMYLGNAVAHAHDAEDTEQWPDQGVS